MKREPGYYWVKLRYSGWTVLRWYSEKPEWVCNRIDIAERPEQIPHLIIEINETRIKNPDEK